MGGKEERWVSVLGALGLVALLSVLLVGTARGRPAGPPQAAEAVADEGTPEGDLELLARVIAGPIGPVAMTPERIVAGLGARLVCLDVVSDTLTAVGYTPLFTSTVADVALEGDLAFVAIGAAGLRVVDVSQPSAPAVLGSAPGSATAVAVEGNTVVTVDGDTLRVFDVTDPGNPMPMGSLPVPGVRLALHDGVAFLAALDEGLVMVSVAQPSAPVEVARLTSADKTMDVALSGKLAFLADGLGGLRIVDTTVLTDTAEVADLDLPVDCSENAPGAVCPTPSLVAVDGDLAVVGMARCDSAFSCRTPPQLRAVDVSDPAQPREVQARTPTANPIDLAVSGDRVLLSNAGIWYYAGVSPCQLAEGSLELMNRNLSAHGKYSPPGDSSAVAASETLAWTIDAAKIDLDAYNLEDPTDPVATQPDATYHLLGSGYGSAGPTDVLVSQDVWETIGPQFAAASELPGVTALPGTGLSSVAPVPQRPQNGCSPPASSDWYIRLGLTDGGPVVLDADGVLRTLDADGQKLGQLADFSAGRELAAVNNTAFVVDADFAVHAVDVSDPASPVQLATIPGPAYRVTAPAPGTYLYAAAGLAGVRVFDVSDPASPHEVGVADTPGTALDVAVRGADMYVADGAMGVSWFDVSSPTQPVLLGHSADIGTATRVAVGSGTVVAATTGGLVVLRAPERATYSAYLPIAY